MVGVVRVSVLLLLLAAGPCACVSRRAHLLILVLLQQVCLLGLDVKGACMLQQRCQQMLLLTLRTSSESAANSVPPHPSSCWASCHACCQKAFESSWPLLGASAAWLLLPCGVTTSKRQQRVCVWVLCGCCCRCFLTGEAAASVGDGGNFARSAY